MLIYSGQLTVDVPNGSDYTDAELEPVYESFRARLEKFAQENDTIIRRELSATGKRCKPVTVDFE